MVCRCPRSREVDVGEADHVAIDHAGDRQAVAVADDLSPLPLVREVPVDDKHRVVARDAIPDDHVAIALSRLPFGLPENV